MGDEPDKMVMDNSESEHETNEMETTSTNASKAETDQKKKQRVTRAITDMCFMDQLLMTRACRHEKELPSLVQTIVDDRLILMDMVETERKISKANGGYAALDVYCAPESKQWFYDQEYNPSYISQATLRGRFLVNMSLMVEDCEVRFKDYAKMPDFSVLFAVCNDVHGTGEMIHRRDFGSNTPKDQDLPSMHFITFNVKAKPPEMTDERRVRDEALLEAAGDLLALVPEITSETSGDARPSYLQMLAHDLQATKADDMFFVVTQNAMKHYKEEEEGVKELSDALQKILDEERNDGVEEGAKSARISTLRNMLKQGLSFDKAMELAGYPETDKPLYAKALGVLV